MLETMEQRTDGIKRQATELIEQAYQRGYKDGREKGLEEWKNTIDVNTLIEQGRNEAWECLRKICYIPQGKLGEVFSTDDYDDFTLDWLCDYSASEAIEKIRAWEEKKAEDDEIRVGDEVASGDTRYIVVRVYNDTFEGIGACGVDMGIKLSNYHKTGRHFDAITEVLEKLKEGE